MPLLLFEVVVLLVGAWVLVAVLVLVLVVVLVTVLVLVEVVVVVVWVVVAGIMALAERKLPRPLTGSVMPSLMSFLLVRKNVQVSTRYTNGEL